MNKMEYFHILLHTSYSAQYQNQSCRTIHRLPNIKNNVYFKLGYKLNLFVEELVRSTRMFFTRFEQWNVFYLETKQSWVPKPVVLHIYNYRR